MNLSILWIYFFLLILVSTKSRNFSWAPKSMWPPRHWAHCASWNSQPAELSYKKKKERKREKRTCAPVRTDPTLLSIFSSPPPPLTPHTVLSHWNEYLQSILFRKLHIYSSDTVVINSSFGDLTWKYEMLLKQNYLS